MFPATTPHTCEGVAGSASATGAHASAHAVEEAIAALGSAPGLVLIFASGDIDPDAVAREAKATSGDALVAGMTGTGVLAGSGVVEAGCSAVAFSSAFSVGVGAVEARDPHTAGRDAAASAVRATGEHPHTVMLLFVDSEGGDQAEVVAGAYEVVGGTVPLAGGAAGGTTRARFADGAALADGVVAVAIGSTTPIGVGIAHGCIPRGAPSIVTRSEGATVLRLDGRPAQEVYFEKLGLDGVGLDNEEFEVLAMVHPLVQSELSGVGRPRYLRARGPDGGLVCATSIERNAAVEICDQTPETIVQSARTAVEEAVSQLHGPTEAALIFDCAARSAWFRGALAQQELSALIAAFGDSAPSLAGAYTRGEIGRIRGAKGDRNHSVVVAAFSAPD